jgi:hypothetical protein
MYSTPIQHRTKISEMVSPPQENTRQRLVCCESLCQFNLKGTNILTSMQCSGSVTFWYRSGSADPYHGLMDPDPEPALFVSDLYYANIKVFLLSFFKDNQS